MEDSKIAASTSAAKLAESTTSPQQQQDKSSTHSSPGTDWFAQATQFRRCSGEKANQYKSFHQVD